MEPDSESVVYRLRPALSSFQVHTRTEVLTWSCLKPQFKDSVHCFFKDTNRPEQECIFLISKTVFFKLVLDLIKKKPLSRRFAYLEELALKEVVLHSKLEADTDEPGVAKKVSQGEKTASYVGFYVWVVVCKRS